MEIVLGIQIMGARIRSLADSCSALRTGIFNFLVLIVTIYIVLHIYSVFAFLFDVKSSTYLLQG